MNEIKTFSNDMFSILIKQDNENNLFDLETVAKSLGFTQFKNGKQYIRWETINKYLGKYLSKKLGKAISYQNQWYISWLSKQVML